MFCFVANDFTLDHVYYVLCDVGGMVRYSLKVAGRGKEMDQALHAVCIFSYVILHLEKHISVHCVYFIIGGTNLPGQSAVHVHKGFDDPAALSGDEENTLAVFRRLRDEIRGWIKEFFGKEDHKGFISHS